MTIDIRTPIHELPAYLTVAEAARYLRLSTRALRRWRALGLLRVSRPAGGYPLVARSEIERLLAEGASR